MEEKKEHHLTKAKRLREEAEAGIIVTEEVETKVSAPVGRPYRVFDSRAALVAQVNTLEEAEEEVARFPGGTCRMI